MTSISTSTPNGAPSVVYRRRAYDYGVIRLDMATPWSPDPSTRCMCPEPVEGRIDAPADSVR